MLHSPWFTQSAACSAPPRSRNSPGGESRLPAIHPSPALYAAAVGGLVRSASCNSPKKQTQLLPTSCAGTCRSNGNIGTQKSRHNTMDNNGLPTTRVLLLSTRCMLRTHRANATHIDRGEQLAVPPSTRAGFPSDRQHLKDSQCCYEPLTLFKSPL